MLTRKAFVLLSGGLDSSTALAIAANQFPSVEGVSIDYGQRHSKEMLSAEEICKHYNAKHTKISLHGVLSGVGVMLTDKDVKVPDISYDAIKGVSPTYVPFRNGTMLSVITAHAQKYVMSEIDRECGEMIKYLQEEHAIPNPSYWKDYYTKEAKDLVGIYFGAHAEDAQNWAYPDCTPEFIGAMANAIYIGSYMTIRLFAPFVHDSKADIVTKGTKLHVPYGKTWSCYKGEELHCGTCPTCRSRKKAFEDTGKNDPTLYASDNEDMMHMGATPTQPSVPEEFDSMKGE